MSGSSGFCRDFSLAADRIEQYRDDQQDPHYGGLQIGIYAEHDQGVVDHGNEHDAVILEWHYATLAALPFDAPELLEVDTATERTAQEGVSYYGLSGGAYRLLNLSTGDTLPTGYDGIFKNAIRSQDASVLRRGYGAYAESAARKWLNSDGEAGQWWNATHLGDMPPAQAETMPGFMRGCSAQILAMARPVRVRTAISASEYTDVYDKFFLPAVSEVNGEAQLEVVRDDDIIDGVFEEYNRLLEEAEG